MSDYSSLKATINANIKANNNHEITGAITNSVLNAMVNSLGAGYQFIGVATPTNPGSAQTPDYKCFYLATTPGTYTNLGSLVVAEGEVAILKYDTAWTKEVTGVATADQVSQLGQQINGVLSVNLLLNKTYSNINGNVYNTDGWVATDKIPLFNSGTIEMNDDNTLGYYFWNVMCYDADGTFIGYFDLSRPSYSVDVSTIKSQYANTAYVAFNVWGGSAHAAITDADVADMIVTEENPDALVARMNKAEADVLDLQADVVDLQADVVDLQADVVDLQTMVGVEAKVTLLLNKTYIDTTGIAYNVNGWVATDKIPLFNSGTIKMNDDNTLGYYFWNVMCYDADGTFIGAFNLSRPSYSVGVATILAQRPNTKFVALNIWGGSEHAAITDSDVADMTVVQTNENSIDARLSQAESDIQELQNEIGAGDVELTVDFTAKTIAVKSVLSANYMVINRGYWRDALHYNYNPCFNFGGTDIVNRSNNVTTRINGEGDNLGAPNTQVGFIGANHGLNYVFNATVNNHGKTFVDIGSEWTGSDGHKWYIVQIVDANKIAFVSEAYLSNGVYQFYEMTSGMTLTHSSGATHTDSMTIGTVERNQWYPSELVSKQMVLLNGKEITESGTFKGSVVDFVEVYDVYNPVSYLNKIRSLVGTLTDNPLPGNYNDIAKWFRICNDYSFTKGGCNVLFVDWIALDTLDLNLFNPIDVKVMNLTALGGGGQYYLPKALPITVDGQTFDYRRPATFDYSKDLNWTEQYWENPNLPPDRGIEFITDGTKRVIGLHHGYLFDQGIGGLTRKDYLANAWWIYTTGAVYAGGVNGGKYGNTRRQQIGSHYGFAAFRKYEDVSENDAGVISVSQFGANDKYYIYVDVEANGVFPIDVADEWCGKEIKVLEKSDNVTLLNDFTQKQIMISVTTASPMYGYLVAEITK